MVVFSIISLLGGLAMFLYGMRLMGTNLREGASGTLKAIMEKVTNNPLKAFLLGVFVTAIIQSSTATIVITSGLVSAGIISLDQSLGIIIGSNVGTTVTGQIIRLLDLNTSGASFLQFFKPSTLAPLALIIGIVFIMFLNLKKSENIGNIAIGFGILFSGLMNMTSAVSGLTEGGVLENIFMTFGKTPVLGYLTGAGIAFVLQSSSATIGILQAFSSTGELTFGIVYVMLVGIYLGDCVTTAIVCSIGAKADSKRVGIVNILFNLSETIVVLAVVSIVHNLGLLDSIWDAPLTSGGIANTNTIFNLGCAILLLPAVGIYARISRKIVKDEAVPVNKYENVLSSLNPKFFPTPAIALKSCYDVLDKMFHAARDNIIKAYSVIFDYNAGVISEVIAEEENIDLMADSLSNYISQLSPHVKDSLQIAIIDQYYKVINEFERLGDHAVNLTECATELHDSDIRLSDVAMEELKISQELIEKIMVYTELAFDNRDVDAAEHIEPLEEVMDDMVATYHNNHLARLRDGKCTINAGIVFMDIMSNLERVSDICSNVGIATIARANPDVANFSHNYISGLHQGKNERFNREYKEAYEVYFNKINQIEM